MGDSSRIITAQQAKESMKQMRKMTNVMSSSSKMLKDMFSELNSSTDILKKEEDEDSDFSNSLINELSNKSIDREINEMIKKKRSKRDSSREVDRKCISRPDMSTLMLYLAKKSGDEASASIIVKRHSKTEKFVKKIRQLSSCDSTDENIGKAFISKVKRFVQKPELFLKKKCALDLTAEEIFRILYNVLTKYNETEYKPCLLRSAHVLKETNILLSRVRHSWNAPPQFLRYLERV